VGFLDRSGRLSARLSSATCRAGADPADADDIRKRAQSSAPVVWLLGKNRCGQDCNCGRSHRDPRAEIGEGFEPCTRTAVFYDVPPEFRCFVFSIRAARRARL